MHHTLRHRKDIQRERTAQTHDSVYLNAACVPRIVKTGSRCEHNFSLVTLVQGVIQSASLVWVDQHGQVTSAEALLPQLMQPLSLQATA
jgi:uncharacterized protein (TIGR04168 family)